MTSISYLHGQILVKHTKFRNSGATISIIRCISLVLMLDREERSSRFDVVWIATSNITVIWATKLYSLIEMY